MNKIVINLISPPVISHHTYFKYLINANNNYKIKADSIHKFNPFLINLIHIC